MVFDGSGIHWENISLHFIKQPNYMFVLVISVVNHVDTQPLSLIGEAFGMAVC